MSYAKQFTVLALAAVGCATVSPVTDAQALAEIAAADEVVAAQGRVVCIRSGQALSCLWPEDDGAARITLGNTRSIVDIATSGTGVCTLDRLGWVTCHLGANSTRRYLHGGAVELDGSYYTYFALTKNGVVYAWTVFEHRGRREERSGLQRLRPRVLRTNAESLFTVVEWVCGADGTGDVWCLDHDELAYSMPRDDDGRRRSVSAPSLDDLVSHGGNWVPEAMAEEFGGALRVSESFFAIDPVCLLGADDRWICGLGGLGTSAGPPYELERLPADARPFLWNDALCIKQDRGIECRE